MKTLNKFGLPTMFAFVLLLVAGCGGSDPAGPSDKETGDLDNPEFQQLMASMDAGELYTEMLINDVFDVLGAVFEEGFVGTSGGRSNQITVTGVEADSVYLVYHATSQFWHWYLQATVPGLADTMTTTIIDSVQFLHADGPVQWPDSSLLTGIHTGALLHMVSTVGSEIEAAQMLSLMGDVVGQGDVTLSGAQSLNMLFATDSCTFTMDLGTTATEVVLNLAHVDNAGCPESGVFQHQGTVGIECTNEGGLTHNDTWTITQTFTGNDTHTVVAENSTTRWTYSGTCLE